MLARPTSGIERSVREHNVRIPLLCDWIEGSVLFGDELSKSDIVDALVEEQVYDDQDFAGECIDNCWAELVLRTRRMGTHYPFLIQSKRIIPREADWRSSSSYSFCLLLSLAEHYDWWTKEFGPDYNAQGEIFEVLVQNSLKASFPDWEFLQTGWSRTTPIRLRDLVVEVAHRVGESVGDIDLWDSAHAKELGLDILGCRHFNDDRQGIIVYMFQCASGGDWKNKMKTPDLEVWRDLVDFSEYPNRGFASPFMFDDKEFKKACVRVHGLFLDRARLLPSGLRTPDWFPVALQANMRKWCEARVAGLLKRSA